MKFAGGRRRFLLSGAVVGGGLLVGYGLFKPRDLLGDAAVLPLQDGEVALNAWLKLGADGRVTVAVPRAEMGQGVYTALAMLVAEELDVPWSAVAVEQAPIAAVYGNIVALVDSAPFAHDDDGWLPHSARWTLARAARVLGVQVTGGSTSVRDAWLPMRTAGACAREMLVRAAAARLEVHPNDLTVHDGLVLHDASGRSLTYAAVAREAGALDPPRKCQLKASSAHRYLGQPMARLDVPDKCTGAAQFGIDIRQASMSYAAIKAAPVFGGKLTRVDSAQLEGRDGVEHVVVLDDAVIVVGKTYWQAQQALDQATVTFADGPGAAASSATIFSAYAQALDAAQTYAYEDIGDARAELASAATIAAEYRVPLLAHACMEPMNCTAFFDGSRAEIWCGNQAPDLLRMAAADALDIPVEHVTLHTPLLGGGFGRRAEADVMLRAVAAAKALPGKAIKLLYSRTEDLQHDTYRPPVLARLRARLDARGQVHAWHHMLASPAVSQAVLGRLLPKLPLAGPDVTSVDGAAFLAYQVAHRRVEHAKVDVPLPVGFWRSVGHSFNAFFTESFMDELALAAARDPLEFRLAHLAQRPREKHVLETLRDLSGWRETLPAGHARGVALHASFHSIVGQVAEVSMVEHRIVVHRVVCVIDCGQVVNPDTVMAQMESGIVYGLSAALFGDVQFEAGRIKQRNFSDYRVLALREMPRIDTHVIASGAEPGGVGEPGTPPIAPAVANAMAALTGHRQRALPLRA